jgi:cytochrome c oxidase subunit 3
MSRDGIGSASGRRRPTEDSKKVVSTTSATLTPARVKLAPREIDARVGMMVFLGSWGMVFATLFFCYAVYRVQSPVWPPAGEIALPERARLAAWVNTALMLASSFVLHWSLTRLARGRAARTPLSIAFVMVCGTAFLALQLETWTNLWQSGLRLQDGLYISLFYAITAFHGLHVLAGLLLWIWVLPSIRRVAAVPVKDLTGGVAAQEAPAHEASDPRELSRHRIRMQSTAMFWHFVDAAWIGTFVIVYLL